MIPANRSAPGRGQDHRTRSGWRPCLSTWPTLRWVPSGTAPSAWTGTPGLRAFGFASRCSPYLPSAGLPRCFRGALQVRLARFDILALDRLGGVVQHAVGRTQASGMRCVDVQHDLQQRRDGGTGCLLQPRDRLPKGKAARFPVGGIEPGFLHPLQQCVGRYADRLGSLINVSLREQCGDRFFLLPPELGTGDEPGFRPIFDGKTLAGWEGDPKYWRVEDGALVGEIT